MTKSFKPQIECVHPIIPALNTDRLFQGKPKTVAPVVSGAKTDQADLWLTYPGPQEAEEDFGQDHQDAAGRHYRHAAGMGHHQSQVRVPQI